MSEDEITPIPAKKDSGRAAEPEPEAIKDYFRNFTLEHVFVHFDFPRVFSGIGPRNESWLFKWCETQGESHLWLAFRVSGHQLESLKEGGVSLREAISLAKGNLYLYRGPDAFTPVGDPEIRSFQSLPADYLPRTDVSFKDGKTQTIFGRQNDQLGIGLHVLADEDRNLTNTNIPVIFQKYISSAAHKVEADSREADESVLSPDYPLTDWSSLQITAVGLGSFHLECVSSNKNVIALSTACELLSRLVDEASNPTIESGRTASQMGKEGFTFAISLLKFVRKFDLSLSIKWASENSPNGFLPLDKRRAEAVLEKYETKAPPIDTEEETATTAKPTIHIEISEDEVKPIQRITLKLTKEEAELLRKPAVGEGGMQALLRDLQKQLKDDDTIVLTPYQIERILKYTSSYGQGGFQTRLRGLARALVRISASLTEG